MPSKNEDLHGNVPDESPIALLLIDMINDFEFPGGDVLFASALPVAERIARLKRQARQAGIPVIYINDNFGRWRSDFQRQVEHCLNDPVRGKPIVQLLEPSADDYYVLKPKHSAFFATPLDLLLAYLKVRTLIITGIAGDVCVLFTASDAYMRDYRLLIPSDCIASLSSEENQRCLQQMHKNLEADIRPSLEIDLQAMKHQANAEGK